VREKRELGGECIKTEKRGAEQSKGVKTLAFRWILGF